MSKCKYPNCNNFNGSDVGLCDFHFQLWQSIPGSEDVEDWCKMVFEEQNAKEEQPYQKQIKKCLYPDCKETLDCTRTLCDTHWDLFSLAPEASVSEWILQEWFQDGFIRLEDAKCYYPDCQNIRKRSSHYCQHHEDQWREQSKPSLDWVVSEYEILHSAPERVRPSATGMCDYPNCVSSDETGVGLCQKHREEYWQTDAIIPQGEWLASIRDAQLKPEKQKSKPEKQKSKLEKQKSILEEANEIVNGSRATDYGDAVESFKKISILATAMSGEVLSPLTCCLVLKAVKLARETNKHKRDNLVDECGYAELENRIRDWMAAKELDYHTHSCVLREIFCGAEEGM